jgi:hypothetical protein
MSLRLLATAILAAAFAACGGGTGPEPSDVLPDTVKDVQEATEAAAATIDTQVSVGTVQAGETVTVTCTGTGFDSVKAKFVVREAVEAPEGQGGDAGPGVPEVVEAPPIEYPPDTALPPGVVVQDHQVRFTRVGAYAIACYSDDAQIVDQTPADVVVDPGPPASIDTKVEPHEIKAGEWVNATCSVSDAYGNEVEAPLSIVVKPTEGVTVSGMSAQLTKATPHSVACAVSEGGIVDLSPEAVQVSPNVPKQVFTSVEPETFAAGESAEIDCWAADFYDNPVEDFPVSIYLPPKIYLQGKTLTSTAAAKYTVKCVPQNVDWKYFTLHPVDVVVVPGPPVAMDLKVVPKKSYYQAGSQIKATATAVDAWDNPIPDAQLAAPSIDPPDGIEPDEADPTHVFHLEKPGDYIMTFRLLGFPNIYADYAVRVVSGAGPVLSILYPQRGATIQGKPSITIMGKIKDDKPLVSVTINGNPPNKLNPDGSFTYMMVPNLADPDAGLHQGLNVFTVDVEDASGLKATTTQGFYFSFKYFDTKNPAAPEVVPDSARAFLNQTFFDDFDHDPSHPNDIATIAEIFLAKLNINSMIPSPVASSGPYKVYISNVHFGKPHIDIGLDTDLVRMHALIPDLHLRVDLKGKCSFLGIDFCPDFDGTVDVDTIDATLLEKLWFGADEKIHAKLQQVDVQLNGIHVKISGIIGWLFGWLIDILVDSFTSQIEAAITSQIGGMLDSMLEDLFSKFEINQSFEIPELIPGLPPSSISILARPSALEVRQAGVTVALDAGVYSLQKVGHDVLGSIGRSNCIDMKANPPTFALPKFSQIEFALGDDALNEALFAVWWGGTLNLPITADMLKDVDLSAYGVSDLTATLDFYLPPILSDCNKDHKIQIQVGDLYADAYLKFNDNPMHLSAFVQAVASAAIELADKDGHKEVGVSLLGVDRLDLEIVTLEMDLGSGWEPMDDSAKAGFLMIIQTQLIDKLPELIPQGPLASFEIPAIDLATLVPDLPPGIALKFVLEKLYRELGYTSAGGHLE